MNKSPAFSSFRYLMDIWDQQLHEENLKDLLDNSNLIFFFSKKGEIYGAPEQSRLVFAKLKCDPKDDDSGWREEANFAAINIKNAINGEQVQKLFTQKDLKSIKVLNKDDVYKKLK